MKRPALVPRRGTAVAHTADPLHRATEKQAAAGALCPELSSHRGASSWHLGPSQLPGHSHGHALSQSHGPGSPLRGTLRAGTSRGWAFGGREMAFHLV